MDHLIINYIPGVWGRIFYAYTTSTDLTNLAEYKQIDLRALFAKLWAAQQNKCGVCKQHTSTWHLNHLLIKICSMCCKDKNRFTTKTEAKKAFFLTTEEDFDGLFSFISHNRRYYLVEDARRRAMCKYGSEDGFNRRYRQFSERSNKIKSSKERKLVRRKGLHVQVVNMARLTGAFASKVASFYGERVELAFMVLGLVPRNHIDTGELAQLFTVTNRSASQI